MNRSSRMIGTGLLAAALLAGCGGSSSSSSTTAAAPDTSAPAAFRQKLDPILVQFETDAKEIARQVQATSAETLGPAAAKFGALRGAWGTASSELEELTAPAAVESEYAAAASTAISVGTDLDAVSTAAQEGRVTEARGAASKLINDLAATKTASQKLERALGAG